jgi:hypothetical protein
MKPMTQRVRMQKNSAGAKATLKATLKTWKMA